LRSKTSLLTYIEADVKKRQERAIAGGRKKMSGTSTLSCLIYHLQQFKGDKITFQQVDKNFCLGFMDYLRSAKSTTHPDKLLSSNTQVDYVTKLITTLNNAIKDDIIQTNPMVLIKREDKPKGYIPEIEYLTNKEINMLANKDCGEDPILKRAFLFSCYTGLRFSDVENLTWEKLRKSDSGKTLLKFVQRKTNKPEYPPISDKAVRWLPEKGLAKDNERIFKLPANGYANQILRRWATAAGITKKISYHVSRHTTATLLLSMGVPLTTVQKIMGHSDIRTTLRYAKVIDKNVSDAVEILDNLPDAA
jgi:integrase